MFGGGGVDWSYLKFNIGTTGDGAARADDFEEWIGLARVVNRQLGNAESRILFDEADHLTGRRLDHDLLRKGGRKMRAKIQMKMFQKNIPTCICCDHTVKQLRHPLNVYL